MKSITIVIMLMTCHTACTQTADSLNIAPNPFDTSTYIFYGLANSDTVSLNLYNFVGQNVKTFIHDSVMNPGYYSIYFPADSLKDGVYFVSLNLGTHKPIVKKIIKYHMSSVAEKGPSNEYILYPNPTSSLLTIPIDGGKNIVITDLAGKICKTIQTRDNKISLPDLKSGSYIIHVFSLDNKLLLTEKIVKL